MLPFLSDETTKFFFFIFQCEVSSEANNVFDLHVIASGSNPWGNQEDMIPRWFPTF